MEKPKNKSKNFVDWALRVNFDVHFLLVNLFCIVGIVLVFCFMEPEEITEDKWVTYAAVGILTLITAIKLKWWTFLPAAIGVGMSLWLGYMGFTLYFLTLIVTIYWMGRYDHYMELKPTGQA